MERFSCLVYRHVHGINIGNKDPTRLAQPKAIPVVYECDLKACPMKRKRSLGFIFYAFLHGMQLSFFHCLFIKIDNNGN
jgi:hypothetical protein